MSNGRDIFWRSFENLAKKNSNRSRMIYNIIKSWSDTHIYVKSALYVPNILGTYSKLSQNLPPRRLLGLVNNFKRLYLPIQYYSFDIFEPLAWFHAINALYNVLKPMIKTILYDDHTNKVAVSLVFIGKRYATKQRHHRLAVEWYSYYTPRGHIPLWYNNVSVFYCVSLVRCDSSYSEIDSA